MTISGRPIRSASLPITYVSSPWDGFGSFVSDVVAALNYWRVRGSSRIGIPDLFEKKIPIDGQHEVFGTCGDVAL